jgi:hypothetical protein
LQDFASADASIDELIKPIEEQDISKMKEPRRSVREIEVIDIKERIGAALMEKSAASRFFNGHYIGKACRSQARRAKLAYIDAMLSAVI